MSILSDRQIKNLCATPTHFRLRTGQELEWIAPPYSDEEIALVKRASDIQWQHDQVREFDPMVREHLSMIDPFVPHQVREEDNKKIVSYGLSSYGYDIRIAPEFKIFTNINSTVIDPLDFDENSFVDFEGDVCIIPPNSFVLARSIEYFRMPKNVTGVVLAKSTYARTGMSCFTGETRIALVDGTSISFEEMIPRYNAGERFFGYSVNGAGNIVVAELTLPKMYREDKVLEVTLDNGEIIRATADHKFMLNDGTYVEAKDLTEGISLMPLYRVVARGYEAVIQPGSFQPISTHVLADAWNIQNGDAIKTHYGTSVESNHKVVSVREVEGVHKTYCLTVPEHGNFALEAGVFVKNCLATPLEAGWEGHVTLEYANSTPLPMKLYANQGAAQVLFFEGEPCMTTYADRGGKYQGQTGITLPRG